MGKGFADDIRQVGVVTRYELLKHLRSKRMYIFILLAVLMIALTRLLLHYAGDLGPLGDMPDVAWYISSVDMLVIIGVSLFCAPAIASEFEERTALLMFPRPMRKTSFFMGKAAACYLVCGGIIILYYMMAVVMSLINGDSVVFSNLFTSMGLALLFMLGTGGFALLMSSILKKGSTAVIVTIAVLFMVFNMVDMMYDAFIGEPLFSITYAAGNILATIYGSLSIFGAIHPTVFVSVCIMTAWAVVTTTISAILFGRREF